MSAVGEVSPSTAADLPEGWAAARVDSLVSLFNGFAFKPSHWKGSGLPIIRIQNLNNPEAPYNYCPDDLPEKFRVAHGDLLFAWSGTPGTSFGAHVWQGRRAWLNQHIFRVAFDRELLDRDFLKHAINQNLRQYITEAHGGAGLAHITKGKFEHSFLVIPPVAEQKRIVAKVEELLGRVKKVRESLAKVPAILKRFRQSVLAAACSGRLTEEWREKRPEISGETVISAIRASRPNTVGTEADTLSYGETCPNTWAASTMGYLAEPTLRGKPFVTSGSRGWADFVGKVGPYFVRSENINTDQLLLDETVRVHAPPGAEAERTTIKAGDLLLTITGNNVGRTAFVPDRCPRAHVSQHVAIVRISPLCNVKYVWLWMRSVEHGQKQLQSYFYGYTKPGLNLEQVRSVTVMLPSADEQEEIVRRVEALFKLADAIEKRVEMATARAEKITQAILAKAFRGELVPTEAELARAEGREYEPASVLLERIRGEREKQEAKGRGRKRKSSDF